VLRGPAARETGHAGSDHWRR